MSITFYAAPQSSASPVSCALRELGVPHERVNLNLAAGDQRKPEYLALNPNGKVPLLVVDGTPLFEALAILQWLGDTYGVDKGLWPAAGSPAPRQRTCRPTGRSAPTACWVREWCRIMSTTPSSLRPVTRCTAST